MSWLINKKADSYSLHLGFKSESQSRALPQYSRHTVGEDGQAYDTVSLTWTDNDREAAVLERLAGASCCGLLSMHETLSIDPAL